MMHGWWRRGCPERHYARVDRQLRIAQHSQQGFAVDELERFAGYKLPGVASVVAAGDDLYGGSPMEFHQAMHFAHVFQFDVAVLPMPALHQGGHAMLAQNEVQTIVVIGTLGVGHGITAKTE